MDKMMFLGVFLLIGLAAAEHAWAPGKVFTYKHTHEVKLGYPKIEAPMSPAELAADVKIQALSANKVFVRLADVSAKETEYARLLQEPFAATIKEGMVKTMEVSPKLPTWAVNILKAKMSVLNLNLMGAALFEAPLEGAAKNAEKAFFRVWEETHFGLCEASYSIASLPAHLATCKEECLEVADEVKAKVHEHLLVTKMVDAHKCKAAAMVAHVMPPVANVKPYAPALNALYTRVVTTQYIIHGDRSNFLVKAIKHVEKVALNPLRGETAKILLETVSSWKLATVAPAAVAAPALPFAPLIVKSVVSEIVPWVAGAVDSITEAPMKKLLPIHKSSAAVVDKVVFLLDEIVAHVDAAYVDPAAKVVATKFMAVEEAIHFLDFAELVAVWEKVGAKFAGAKFVTAKAYFLDALAMAGTSPCVALIKKLVVEGAVPTEQTAVIIMTLPMAIKTPTPALLKELHALVHTLKTIDETLYSNALLAFSNVIYHHCVKPTYMKAMAPAFAATASGIQFCDTKTPVVVDFLKHLEGELKVAKCQHLKFAAVKALANTAHPMAVEMLRPVIFGTRESFFKIQAITALSRAAECHKMAVVDMLMGVFVNLKEDHEVRIAAATVVLAAHPHHHILAKFAVSTWYEHCEHVHLFIQTALKCLAVAKLPVDPMVNHAAKAALAIMKPAPALVPFSFHAIYADYIKDFSVGAAAGGSVIASGKSVIPRFVHQFFIAMEGYPAKRFEASFAAAGFEEAIMAAAGKHNVEKVMDIASAIHPKVRSAWKETMSKFMVQDKFEAVEPVKAAAWFRIHDAMEAAVVLDGADGLMEKLVAFAIKATFMLKSGLPLNVQKTIPLVDTMVVIPTEVGHPAQVRIVVPFSLSLKGSIKIKTEGKPSLEAVLKPVFSGTYHAKTTMFCFPTETIAEAGIVAHAQVAVPAVKFMAAFDQAAKAVEFSVVPAAVAVAAKIIHVHIAPYTAFEPFANIIAPVTQLPSFKAIKRAAATKEVLAVKQLKALVGLEAWLEHETDTPVASIHQMKAFLMEHYKSPLSFAVFPYYLFEKVINHQKLSVAVDFAASPAKEFKFVTKYFASVAEEVADAWAASKDAAPAEAGIFGMFSDDAPAAVEEAGETAMAVQVEKPFGVELRGVKVHNFKVVASFVGPAFTRVFEHVISAAVTPDFKLAHLKYVLAVPAVPEVTAFPFKIIVESSVANQVRAIAFNAKALYGAAARAPEAVMVKSKLHKSEFVRIEEAAADIKYFDSFSMEVAHSKGQFPAIFHHVVKAGEHFLTFVFFPYMSAEFPAKIVPGKFAVDVVINPKFKVCDVVLKKEAEIIAFKGIAVPAIFAHVLPVPVNMRGIEALLEKADKVSGGLIKPACVVDAVKVVTFDGFKVPLEALPLEKEVMLAKFAGAKDSAVISMVKKALGVTVKVVKADKVIKVEASPAGVAVAVDGAPVAIMDVFKVVVGDVVVAKIVKVEKGVEVVMPFWAVSKDAVRKIVGKVAEVVDISAIRERVEDFDVEVADRVLVTRDAVVVKITPINRGKMVGVCGNFNGERLDDMDAALEKKVEKADDFSKFFSSEKVRSEKKMDDSIFMEAASKRIERLFSKFAME